jgi:hypothetical protein
MWKAEEEMVTFEKPRTSTHSFAVVWWWWWWWSLFLMVLFDDVGMYYWRWGYFIFIMCIHTVEK